MTSRMEVDFPAVRSWLGRVWIENSLAAQGASAAGTRTPLRLSSRITIGRLLGDMQVDPRFEIGANGAQSIRLWLRILVADPADLLRRPSSVEEIQTCIELEHQFPLDIGLNRLSLCQGRTHTCWEWLAIPMPRASGQQDQAVRSGARRLFETGWPTIRAARGPHPRRGAVCPDTTSRLRGAKRSRPAPPPPRPSRTRYVPAQCHDMRM